MKQFGYIFVTAAALVTIAPSSEASDFIFLDHFNRPNGTVGRDWSPASDDSGGNLVVRNSSLTTSNPGCVAGITRPLRLQGSDVATISADITQENGNTTLRNRYSNGFYFHSTGSISSGYGISFGRSDSTTNSTVVLRANGAPTTIQVANFNYGKSIHVSFSLFPNGAITGFVTDNNNHLYGFQFPAHSLTSFTGNNVIVVQECPDVSGSPIIYPTIDNLQIEVR